MQSGKRFRRPTGRCNDWCDNMVNSKSYGMDGFTYCISADDIIATDWELEEEKSFTWSQIEMSLKATAHKYFHTSPIDVQANPEWYDIFRKQLGFSE